MNARIAMVNWARIRNGKIVSIPEDSTAALNSSKWQELELKKDSASYDNRHNKLQEELAIPLNEAIRSALTVRSTKGAWNTPTRYATHGTLARSRQRRIVSALATAEQAVEEAKEVVRLVAAEDGAGKLHETIVRYTEIAKALGPEGVRAKMLESGAEKLNGGLANDSQGIRLAAHCGC